MRRLIPALVAIAFLAVTSALAGEVPLDPKLTRPLPVGAPLPVFTVRTVDGTSVQFGPDKLAAPLILIFYRGGWCPYCNAHLAELSSVEPTLLDMGFEVVFMSADRPELLRSTLKEPDVRYTLLSDSRMEAARALGIAFRVDDATVAKYKSYNVDLEKASGETHHELPVPSVFVIGRDGVIRFVYSNPDYKVRIKSTELLAAASSAAAQAADRPAPQ